MENNLRKIEPYVPGEQSKEKDIVKINANENPYPPSPKAIEALQRFSAQTLRFYPPADATPLKQAIADYYGLKKENVFVGNGSDDVIALSFQAFFNGTLPIVYPDITYSFYPVWCSLLKIPYRTIPLIAQLCLTLCSPMDCSLPGSSVQGIFQARELEWVAIFFSRGSF